MPALTLKTYQSQALASLARFLEGAEGTGSLAAAWAQEKQRQAAAGGDIAAAVPYRSFAFGDTPCVCLRIPTGGGKTLLASHAIELMARVWRRAAYPVALWLVPSTTIRDQTLKALQKPGHAYRAALEAAYGDALAIGDLDAAATLAPQDLGRKAIVLVATMQSFRVRQTQGRNVYAFSEEFDAHFAHLRAVASPAAFEALEKVGEDDLAEHAQGFLTCADLGRVKHSLANWLALAAPLVIVDEAHNAKTDTTFETLRRVRPSAILELTATPLAKNTNVLYSVSARELQAESMIKLPVLLAEHKDWMAAVRDAVLRRRHLESEAAHEDRYLRPIVLFQAERKGGAVTPDALVKHLREQERIAEDEIVVATGNERGLDGVDLFDPKCPVRFVITIEALKEGWDCPFAYVLCSLQNVRSGKDVEQLLGRVLRMPYAAKRKSPALNRAYAHVVARSFSEAATALVDRMVEGMGFEAHAAATALLPDPGVPGLFDAPGGAQPRRADTLVLRLPVEAARALAGEPDLTVQVQEAVATGEEQTWAEVRHEGEVSDATLARVLAAVDKPAREGLSAQVEQHNQRLFAARAPAARGVRFAAVPRLCVGLAGAAQDELQLFERETLSEIVDFDLLRADPRPELAGLRFVEQSDLFEIDIRGVRMEFKLARDDGQLTLDAVPSQANEQDVVIWLTGALRRPGLTDAELTGWTARLVGALLARGDVTLTAALRGRHLLAQAAARRIDDLEAQARRRGFEQLALLGADASDWRVGTSPDWQFSFQPDLYPARNTYQGRYRFAKHYFAEIHGLKAKGEEFECAKALDMLDEVRHWVRNVEQQQKFSFWLPTATDYFYPDFVAELHDGRLFVIEYKGEAYATNDDSREKRAIGAAWARASDGQGVFVMVEREVDGLDMGSQLRRALTRA
jgi:type III restriction enzyme